MHITTKVSMSHIITGKDATIDTWYQDDDGIMYYCVGDFFIVFFSDAIDIIDCNYCKKTLTELKKGEVDLHIKA